ncbi:MAG: DUF1489 domain-containing protein [Caulobacteraceae bacterium]|nr:DUF1489 domain-containing protein [Caulobacteraceae bacterium]
MPLHMIKLCVGCDTVQDLVDWHASGHDEWIMRTRQTPKRAAELMDGGSLYRVFKGMILCRQRIELIETVGEGVNARCEVTVSPEIVLTVPTPRRAFQGWRYLQQREAPPDLSTYDNDAAPPELARQLREIGAW